MTIANGSAPCAAKTIVFVDNDRLILEAMAELLTAQGYAVHVARDGLEALSVIRRVKPDYIILDIVIPKIDGGRVCAAVRQDPLLKNTPIIAFSGLSPQDYRLFPGLSADAYVAKGPLTITLQNILKAIGQLEEPGRETTGGQILGYEDFRSRRLVDELLRERLHLVAILQVVAPGALAADRDGRIVMANPGACEILGKREPQLIGEHFATLFPMPEQEGVQDLVTDLVRSEEPAQCHTAFRLADTVVAARLVPIVEDNACTGLLVILEGKESTSGEEL